MGELSPEEEKRFSAKWGAYFDYPTPESVAYFNKLNPLLMEFLSLRAAIATAAVEFDGAWEEAVIAAGYESENGIRESLAIAEMQKNQLLNMQARLGQVVKEINAIGNPPDVQEAKKTARKKHQETMKTAKKAIKAEKDLIASLQTGQIVHTRTPFDDYAQAQFINNIKENQRRGWNKQELKEFRNSASAGSVGMDYDIGLVEKANWIQSGDGKMVRNNWLQQNGKAQTIEKWQTDAQKAWNKAYHDTTGRSAKQSWETVTSSANLESYRDLNLLGADKSKVQSIWAQQSADVTRYKMQHMLHDPALSKMEALQEASRGAAKDMNTKLIPLMEQAKAQGSLSSQALAESKRHWQKVQSVLDAFGKNEIDPITAQRRIRELTGKGIPEVVDDGSFLLESMIKGKK